MRMKRKTVWAYLDGKKLCDVVQAIIDYVRKYREQKYKTA